MKNSADFDSRDFISRELSWIDFNSRVLDEASFEANKLLERLKFISIVSSNLDEFFMVRIAGLRQLADSGENKSDPAGNTPERQLALARVKISRLVRRQYNLLMKDILPQLTAHGVTLCRPEELLPEFREADRVVKSELLIQAHYDGYLQRETLQISRLSRLESTVIPEDFDYETVSGLSNESRQKLIKRRPATLGQASRIDGVTPSDIALLQVLLKKHPGETK